MRSWFLILALVSGCADTAQSGDTDTDPDTDTDTDTDTAVNVVINELLASNDSTWADEDGDYDDWVELYNGGSTAVDIGGWGISDDIAGGVYVLPTGTVIEAGGHLLIWCDDDGEGLHTDWKISSGGETLTLVDADNVTIDEVSFSDQETDISYGRDGDGSDTWTTFPAPTPGLSNE